MAQRVRKYKKASTCMSYELGRPPAAGATDGCGHGGHGRLLRGHLRLLRWHVHLLFQGETHLHEPLQGHGGGIQAELRREEELPQIAGVPHLQGQHIPQQDRGHDSQPDHRGVLRRLFPSVREIHGEAACGVAAEAACRLQDGGRLREVQPRDGGHRPPDKRQ